MAYSPVKAQLYGNKECKLALQVWDFFCRRLSL